MPLFLLLACATGPAQEPEGAPALPTAPTAEATSAPIDTLDVWAWLAEVRALNAEAENLDSDTLFARSRRLANRLQAYAGVDWQRACNTYRDPSTGEEVYEPADPAAASMFGWAWGLMDVVPLGSSEALVSIQCSMGAYQGTFSLVHVAPGSATLLRAPVYDEHGEVEDPMATNLSGYVEDDDPSDRRFSVFIKSAGHGGCGVWTLYELGEGTEVEAVEVRARDCDPAHAGEPPPPEAWPVVYAR